MKKSKSILRAGTACLAALLLAVTILVSSHAHAASNPEKSDTCATCHLLPQGLQFLTVTPGVQLSHSQFCSEILPPGSSPKTSFAIFSGLIRGPPAQG